MEICSRIQFRVAGKKDVDSIVQIHQDAFQDFFLTSLGHRFLRTYYRCFISSDESVCIVAEERDAVVGFAVSACKSNGFNKRLVLKNLFPFIAESIKLLFTHPKSLLQLLGNFSKKSDTIKDDGTYAELFSIGVKKMEQGRGIGGRLLEEIECLLSKRGIEQLSLTTDYFNNDLVRRFYQSKGFNLLYEFNAYPNRRMCRLIKSLNNEAFL